MSCGKYAGIVGMVKMMDELRTEPASVPEFVARLGLSHTGAVAFLHGMRALGMAHVCGWYLPQGQRPMPRFALGAGEDVAPPERTNLGRKSEYVARNKWPAPSASLIAFVYALRELEAHACTALCLREATGMTHSTALRLLRELMATKFVRIEAWIATTGKPLPAYRWGFGRAAKLTSHKERRRVNNAAYWQRRKQRMHAARLMHALAANSTPMEQAA
jgi:hypothetical protein